MSDLRSLNHPEAVSLLAAIGRAPRQAAGAYWSGHGVRMRESEIRYRLKLFLRDGLVDRTSGPALTPAGREALRQAHPEAA